MFQRKEQRAVIVLAWKEDTDDETNKRSDETNKSSVIRFMLCMIIRSPVEMEFLRRNYYVVFKSTRASRDRILNQLIEFLGKYIRDVNKLYRDTDSFELGCSLAGLVSSALTITGTVLAFFTFGTSLALNVAGGALAVCGGAASLSIQGRRVHLKKKQFRQLKNRHDELTEENERLFKVISEGEYFGLFTGTASAITRPIGLTVNSLKLSNVNEAVSMTSSAASMTTKSARTVVKELGVIGKVTLGFGTGFAVISGATDIYSIYKLAKRRLKGERCNEAKQAHALSRTLEEFRSSSQNTAEIDLKGT